MDKLLNHSTQSLSKLGLIDVTQILGLHRSRCTKYLQYHSLSGVGNKQECHVRVSMLPPQLKILAPNGSCSTRVIAIHVPETQTRTKN